jgi:hypothetical protein
VRIDPKVKALDPHAGRRCAGMSSPMAIELDIPRAMAETLPKVKDGVYFDGVVTPQRLRAWRAINSAIRRAIAEQLKQRH